MSEPLEPIPTPPSTLWRHVRLQYLPVVVFAIALVTAILLWRHYISPVTLVGEAEAIHADVRSVRPGLLANVTVKPFQTVRAGQTIAQVITTDPKLYEASLAVIRAELDSIQFTMNPILGQQRTQLDYEKLMMDLMHARVDLASLQAQLVQAENVFTRTQALFANKLVTDERFEEVKNNRDSLDAQVKAQTELISRLEPGLKGFTAEGPNAQLPKPAEGLRAAIKIQEEKLRLTEAQLGPVTLLAPIDGVVSLVNRQPGEAVVAGEAIFQISSTHSERIIGFIRQPISHEPKPGAAIEVRTRTMHRQVAAATVAQVGAQLEPIIPTLLLAMHLQPSKEAAEVGLRVIVTLPAGLNVRPGEQVDLVLRD